MQETIGFIGQGWIGKHYADDFERRGYLVVRYSKEEPYVSNKEKIKDCEVVFIAVPTPTTPSGFDMSIVREVLGLVGIGKTAVIKSTILPGTTETLAQEFADRFVLHSPEFLSERSAQHDVEHPDSNVIGIPVDTPEYRARAEKVLQISQAAPPIIATAREAEFMKYAYNVHGYIEIVYMNMLFDMAQKLGVRWDKVHEFIGYNKYMVVRYADPVHASGHTDKAGRGAGGHCLIKDFAAFRTLYDKAVGDAHGSTILKELEAKNLELLRSSGKDLDLVRDVYGDTESH